MTEPLPLNQLGRYRVVRVIGQGSMGVVYEGLDPRLDRPVAIKTILKSQLVNAENAAEYSARFVREAKAVARLNHPNIVTVFDFGEENEIAYIVMEFIRGRELSDYFEKKEFFSIDEAVRIMCEMLEALDYAHKQGIVHRDIKPANLMLDASGRAKLTDFGVARMSEASHDRTVAGTMVGTPSYMSPEQIKGESVGPRADIFAAGVLLYQFLTHEKPFKGQGQWAVQKNIMEEEPAPPSSFRALAVPAVFDRIARRALAKNPADRYPSAGAFAADLEHALATMAADQVAARAAASGGGKGPAPEELPLWAQDTVVFDASAAARPPVAPGPAGAAPPPTPVAPTPDPGKPSPAPAKPAPAPAAAKPAPEPAVAPASVTTARSSTAPPTVGPRPSAAGVRAAEAPRARNPLIAGGIGAAVLIGAVAAWMLLRGGPPATEPARGPSQPAQVPAVTPAPEPLAQVADAAKAPAAPVEDDQARVRRLEEDRRIQAEARQKEEEALRAAAAAKAPGEAGARTQDDAKRKADLAAKRKAELEAQRKAQEEARFKAEQEARLKAEQEAQRRAQEEARAKAEQEAKLRAEQEARRRAEEEARAKARAQQEAQRRATTEGSIYDQVEAMRKSDEGARKQAPEAARKPEPEAARKQETEAPRKPRTPAELVAEASRLEGEGKASQAVRLYREAAAKGSAEAARKLGDIYAKGSGDVPRDYAEALRWYSLARERGLNAPVPDR